MKPLLSLLAILFAFQCSYAQWTTSGNDIYNSNSGNVGIGMTTPLAKLSIQGPYFGTSLIWTDAANNTGYLSIRGTGAALGADNNLYFETSVGSAPVEMARFIGSTGNFGIGTTTPDAKLAVNGTIHSKEVKVDMLGWPDYVFKPQYNLPSLTEVKTYIDQNQHLLGMPSEKEVAKDGINLGEMNKLLVKKVEELTLYLIEKDQNEKAQRKEIDQLKRSLEAITKEIHKN